LFTDNYITGSCTISNNEVIKNGSLVFENKGADLPAFLLSVYQHYRLSYPKFYKMDNLSKSGWLASEVLLNGSFNKEAYKDEEVGLVLANSSSSLDNDLKYFDTIKDVASPSVFVYTLPNIVIGEICIRNKFKGEHAFYIQQKFDAGFIATQVNYLLNNSILKACICGWVEVLGEEYKAVLFLIEKKKEENSVLFSADEMNRIFENSL
jgi:hypothetical protein